MMRRAVPSLPDLRQRRVRRGRGLWRVTRRHASAAGAARRRAAEPALGLVRREHERSLLQVRVDAADDDRQVLLVDADGADDVDRG